MALRLFEHPLSPYAQKVKIVLYEKGIPFERVFIDPNQKSDDRSFQEFVIASPRREVPCLVEGDTRVFDSTVMLEFIDERWPNPASMPASPAERARIRMLEEMMDSEFEAVVWGLMELRVFRRAEGEKEETLRVAARSQLARLRTRLERELESRDWMSGAQFGRGDAAVLPHLGNAAIMGEPLDASHPRLLDWFARCEERESVKKVAAETSEGIRRSVDDSGAGRPAIVRQYRDHRLEWMMKSGGVDVVLEGLEKGTIRFAEEFE